MDKRKRFTKTFIEYAPEKPGIYFIWQGDTYTCYYVGKADKSIKSRLKRHLQDPSQRLKAYLANDDATFSFKLMEGSSSEEIFAKETLYIKKFNPHGNISQSNRIRRS